MPTYDFKCCECEDIVSVELSINEITEELSLPCSCVTGGNYDPDAEVPETRHTRVFTTFGLGTVNGAGGSPGRFGNGRKG